MKFNNRNINGFVGTVIFHLALLFILLSFSFTPAEQEFPEPEGIVVDFGEMVEGDQSVQEETVEQEQTEEQEEVEQTTEVPSEDVPEPDVATQENESPVSVQDSQAATEEKADVQEEISREEKERIERERKEQEEKERIDAMFNNKFDGQSGNSDFGQESGDPGDSRSTAVGDQKGSPGNPYGNSDATSWSKPANTQNCNKSIQLTVRLDNLGNVVAISQIETALSAQGCIDAAKKAAKKVKFPSDKSTIGPRYAVITYEYTISRN
ncbi:MAG: hypothetical protein R6U95_04430 [Bacteroidales bacterium]